MIKNIGIGLLAFVGLIAMLFVFGLVDLGMFKFFGPKRENVRREVFEQTKSYVHGKTQDLAKYYEEYQRAATMEEKEIVSSIIKIRLAEFDAGKIQSLQLKQFLINVRGY